jgi:hypothetical protein
VDGDTQLRRQRFGEIRQYHSMLRMYHGYFLPSKQFLKMHAACCKVAIMSGAAKYLEDVDRESADTCVLASDGGSASVFKNMVWRAFYSSPSIKCAY